MDTAVLGGETTLAQLARQAARYERQAAQAQEPQATELRKTARILRAWIAELLAIELRDGRA
jgi:hypothetical protein